MVIHARSLCLLKNLIEAKFFQTVSDVTAGIPGRDVVKSFAWRSLSIIFGFISWAKLVFPCKLENILVMLKNVSVVWVGAVSLVPTHPPPEWQEKEAGYCQSQQSTVTHRRGLVSKAAYHVSSSFNCQLHCLQHCCPLSLNCYTGPLKFKVWVCAAYFPLHLCLYSGVFKRTLLFHSLLEK